LHKIAVMETKSSREEIDILVFLVKIVDQLRAALLLTVILPVAGGLVGFFVALNAPTKVQSDMMLATDLLSEEQCQFLLSQFEKSDAMANTTPELPSDFTSIRHEIIRPFRYIPDVRTVHVQISITLKDRRSFPAFQNAILDFLENSPAAISRKKDIQEYEAKMIEGIDRELAEIEKIKNDFSGKDKLNSLNAADLHVQTITLLDKKLELKTRTGSGKVFTVVDGFSSVACHEPPVAIATIFGIAAGVFVLSVFLGLQRFRSYYRTYKKTRT
jgi:hypothetical protein